MISPTCARKDVEEHRELCLRLSLKYPRFFFLFSLSTFSLRVELAFGTRRRSSTHLRSVSEAQDWHKAPPEAAHAGRYGKIQRIKAIRGEGGPALICENQLDSRSGWIRFRTTGEVGESANQGQESLR